MTGAKRAGGGTDMERGDLARRSSADKVADLKDQVDGVKNIMPENVERILARGEGLDDIDMTEALERNANQFEKRTNKVASYYKCKTIKLIVFLVAIALIVVFLIVLLATGVIPVSSPTFAINSTTPKP